MVHFILGRAGSGKSQEVVEQVRKLSKSDIPVFVVVPEQFTFETERKYYRALGAARLKNVIITSFTRIAHQVFKKYGGAAGDYADDSIKLILMSVAIDEVKSELSVYASAAERTSFSSTMVDLITELKNADLDSEAFLQRTDDITDRLLREKSRDISKIYAVYDALLCEQYKDHLDDLSRAVALIREHGYFEDSVVFIDEFKGFTEREFLMLRVMMESAQDVTISLCLDPNADGENQLFYPVGLTYQKCRQLARLAGQRIEPPKVLRDSRRFVSPELSFLERHIFSSIPHAFPGERGKFHAVLAANEYDEADYTAATIRSIVQEQGYRYRDIVVVSRDLETVESCLENAFLKYNIPYYFDKVKQIGASPLIRMIELCFSCLCGGMSSENLISLLKCGFCGYSVEEIALLENYIFLWDIRSSGWKEPFTRSIFGVDQPANEEELTQHTLTLLSFNAIREHLYRAFSDFRIKAKDGTVSQIAGALSSLLEDLRVRETVNKRINALTDETLAQQLEEVQEQRRVWEITEEILRLMSGTIGNRKLPLKRFCELFSMLAGNFDLGTLPQTVDCVTVGSAERIRTDCPKVLFVLEANDQVFPYIPQNSGLFTDRERQSFAEMGMELSKPLKDKIREEKFIAYKTLAIPSEQLYIVARKADMKGSSVAPSYLFGQFKRMFGEEAVTDTDDIDRLYFCRTKPTAFSALAYQFRQDTPFTASLRYYFDQDSLYKERMEGIMQNLSRRSFHLDSRDTAKALYGESVYLSPTQVEKYHLCKFRYFCEHGLRLQPRKKVQLKGSGRGLVIHNVLYAVCSQITDFSHFDPKLVGRLVEQELDHYLDTAMGGKEGRSKRFLYLYRKLRKTLMDVLQRLFAELSQSLFRPVEFEYKIGEPGHVRPLAIQTPDGLRLYLRGTVDRIDAYETPGGQHFLRVIDYKSGDKTFRLSDLMNGINLQMFLYLMCLEKNGKTLYQEAKGAGVLYMPAGDLKANLPREADGDLLEKETASHFRMSGVVLDDEAVLRAMERDLAGRYTPITVLKKAYGKDDQLRENVFIDRHANEELFSSESMKMLLTSEQMGRLYGKLTRTLQSMAEELYSGNIEVKPLQKSGQRPGCEYCEFSTVCGFEDGDEVNQYQDFDKAELFAQLENEENQQESDR